MSPQQCNFGKYESTCPLKYNSCKVSLLLHLKLRIQALSFQYTFGNPNTYSYINSCSQSCTPGVSYDENGFKFITKCSKPDEQCPIGQGWSKYFSDESDIVSQGELETCFPGFHFCKVSILKDMFQAFI